MRHLKIRLAGNETPLHPLVPTLTNADVFRDARMLNWSPSFDPPRATVLLYLDGALDLFMDELAQTDLVVDHDLTRLDPHRGYANIHSEPHPVEWQLFEMTVKGGLIPAFPFPYHSDGSMTLRIVGPAEQLQAAVESTPDGIDATIEQVGEYALGQAPIPPRLPHRQLEALAIGLKIGYYEIPRDASRDDVANALGCAPSTASEHLRKGERRVIETYLGKIGT